MYSQNYFEKFESYCELSCVTVIVHLLCFTVIMHLVIKMEYILVIFSYFIVSPVRSMVELYNQPCPSVVAALRLN